MSILLRALRSNAFSGPVLEIGTAAGGTLRELMRAYPAEARPRFVVVDPMTYFPEQLSVVRRNLASAGIDPSSVDFRVDMSWPAFHAAERAGERFSFIFIDGSHKVHRVTQDLAWTRLLNTGGLLCLHDYIDRMPGVVSAVDRFLSRYPNYQVVERVDSLLVIRKNAPSQSPEIERWDRVRAHFINLYYQVAASAVKRLRSR